MTRSLTACLIATAALAALAPVAVAAPAGALALGIYDGRFSGADAARTGAALALTRAAGAGSVRILVRWSRVEPRRPAAPTDPADPAFDWTAVDGAVRAAAAAGLDVLLDLSGGAPRWAEGAGAPAGTSPGTWKPDAAAYRAFAAAAARRYSGGYPDPAAAGAALPAVRHWQAWNEPNLALDLAPQWERRGGRLRPAAPALYRALLDGLYAGVKGVSAANVVVTAGTAPFGDPLAGGRRLSPVRFWRQLLCLDERCAAPARFDVWSHHPYGVAGPQVPALRPTDVAVPDMDRIGALVRAAVRRGGAAPRRAKPSWVTEVSWDSRPPDPRGVPAVRQAQWLEQSLYLLWRQGVRRVYWYEVVDQPPLPSYAATIQSGLYRLDGTPKPAASAFRLPLVGLRSHGRLALWGRTPVAAKVTVSQRVRGGWRRVGGGRSRAGVPFTLRLAGAASGGGALRASIREAGAARPIPRTAIPVIDAPAP